MVLFGRLMESILGYLAPGDTPRNQRAPLYASPTPQINANGKRVRHMFADKTPKKRFKNVAGNSVDLTPPSIRIVGPDSDSDYQHGDSSDETVTNEWDSTSNIQIVKDSLVSEYGNTKKLLSHFESPEYKKRLAQDKTNVQPDKVFDEADLKALKYANVLTKREEDARFMREVGWAEDPIRVYLKLTMRGWEPLFPSTWRLSFDSFPRILFAKYPEDAYIKALSENEFRAMKAFRALVMIGSKARDATLKEANTPPSRQPQELILRELKNYMKWAFADSEVSDVTPTLAVLSGPEDVDPVLLERKMIKRLTRLKREWLDNLALEQGEDENGEPVQVAELAAPPTLYGIIVSNLMICLVALEDEDDGCERPRIHAFSWNNMANPAYDVWTTITMAILVIHCREEMLRLKRVMEDFDLGHEESDSQQEYPSSNF